MRDITNDNFRVENVVVTRKLAIIEDNVTNFI